MGALDKLSFIIPCYGSEQTIEFVLDEIAETIERLDVSSYEVICVNDCSPDRVEEVIRKRIDRDANVTLISLSRNFGKHSALMAGLAQASGDVMVLLDDDGQCPVDHLDLLLAQVASGQDVAIAEYPRKKQSALKNFGSALNNTMAHILVSKPKDLHLSNFIAMRAYVAREILKYTGPYPYMDGLILRVTKRIVNVAMEERERFSGEGNFGIRKSLSLWLNGFTSFSVRPLRIATILGTLIACVGFVFVIVLIVQKLLDVSMQVGYASTMAVLLFIGGVIMMMLGLLGEYIGRTFISLNQSPQYVVREMVYDREERRP
ncbi:MAG: glycosyltransferase [Coriobacteriales bacterium]|jgi:undecaprenyl-phosphate 4-deoxy-4-formamido-L-arabinose transferase|nr:glycosyltransferase [Coriobacteriales bacterium]